MNPFIHNLRGFWHSFDLDIHFLLALFFDVLFLLGVKLLSLAQHFGIQNLREYASAINLGKSTITAQSLDSLQIIKTQTLWVIVWVVIMVLLFLFILIAIYSVCNYLIWIALMHKKELGVWKQFWRFYLLNLVWFVILGIFLLPWIGFIARTPDFAINLIQYLPWLSRAFFAVIGIIVILHPLLFLQYSFFKYQRVSKTIGGLFTTGFGNLSKHILQYCLGSLVVVITTFVVFFVQQFVPAQAKLYLALLVGLVLLNWFKAWFLSIEKNVQMNNTQTNNARVSITRANNG